MLKQTLTHLREKCQGDFQGSKMGTLRNFYSSGEISVHLLILCSNFMLFCYCIVRQPTENKFEVY